MEQLFQNSAYYHNFTSEHWYALLFFALLYVVTIKYGRSVDSIRKKRNLLIFISFLAPTAMLLRILIDAQFRDLSLDEDLPLHLCRLLSLVAPLVILQNNEKVLRVFYVLALAGTLNAMITADIVYGFPSYGYILYWAYHGTLVLVGLYGIIVFKLYIRIKDTVIAFIIVNIYYWLLHLLNLWLDSNYMYSRYKPDTSTIMDHLGPWPIYILWLEALAIAMVLIIYLIFRNWSGQPRKLD